MRLVSTTHHAPRPPSCPRSLTNLRQNCLRLIVNVDGSLGLVAVPTTQTITPIFTGAGAVRARQWSFGPPQCAGNDGGCPSCAALLLLRHWSFLPVTGEKSI